ncbi:DUF4175 family protein [Maribacter halichondriae]|uniref:DUF4175 family protein n=1 Tax=Maribacter halichondriae TaxID=2980554 RepID=UPI002359573F|nr:DUF4175 family protein [Maribacter sp. Hal144]
MTGSGKNILIQLQNKWKLRLWFEIFLYSFGGTILIYRLDFSPWLTILLFLTIAGALIILKKPWRLTLEKIASHIDRKLDAVEYSSGLLLLPKEQMSYLAMLQEQKVIKALNKNGDAIVPKKGLKSAMLFAGICLLLGFLFSYFNLSDSFTSKATEAGKKDIISFQPADSLALKSSLPKLLGQKVTISYPAYAGIKPLLTTKMNVQALEGSKLSWEINFDNHVDSVFIERNLERFPMQYKEDSYSKTMVLNASGFYNFRFVDRDGGSYVSDLYALEAIKDQMPTLEIQGLDQFSSFESEENKQLQFKTLIKDDYGIENAQIIATVSKGSGESVKFREEKLPFANSIKAGSKQLELSKKIDLDKLKMEPGDELYFYIEATDTKRPKPNTTRSETFFAVIKDTTSNQFAVEGTLGADLMPDYFRSQRQLIIDTEKLIAQKSKLTKQAFNSTSNELGFDQKALRLKYGEFMGDEADSGIQVTQEVDTEEQKDDNPLAEYTHDHDGSNEPNLVDHDHQEADDDKKTEDPLHDYLHDHDDPEESTLFTQSLKSKLRQAMAEMWDAELYLRLYTPKKSLPYQYRALKLIQEIKNSARIYVHRIGFDPPPIKEEVRLTGDIVEVGNYQKIEEIGVSKPYPNIRSAIQRLQQILVDEISISELDKTLLKKQVANWPKRRFQNPVST